MKIEQIKASLKDKLLTLTTGDLIKAIPDGLRNQHTEIDIKWYAYIEGEVCFGRTTTNAILELLGIPAHQYMLGRQTLKILDMAVLTTLERFFDALRRGEACALQVNKCLKTLNVLLSKEGHFQPIKYPEYLTLTELTDDCTEKDLQAYEKLADFQGLKQILRNL